MARATSLKRWAVRGGLAGIAAGALVLGGLVAVGPAQAAAVNPYSPAAGHPARRGAVPTLEVAQQMAGYRAAHPRAVNAAGGPNLMYGGAVDGIGVTSGKPRVYIVFWGRQWGTAGTDSNGNTTLSGDAAGMAPRVQQLMKGIGAAGELWSGVMTQYCEGIAKGSVTCPAGATHVGYPTGGAFAGVWVDNGADAPASATEEQIGNEAVAAAGHFGNTNATLNRNAQYVIVSPHGTTPDGFNTPNGGFCAWHDYSGDTSLTPKPPVSPYGDIAFTNLPYVTDAGGSCGQNFVNKTGTTGALDGVTIVEGHEYAETISDQNPPGGWVDSSGEENGDKCAWITPGTGPGASADVLFTTGSFAMQSTWANDANNGAGGCEMSHPIVGGNTGGTDFAVAVAPISAAVTSGTSHTLTATVSTQVIAGSPGTVSLSVGNLPTGATASLSPTSVAAGGTSTLTLHTTSSTPNGNYLISIKGTAGSVVRQAPFQLAVYAPTGSVSNGSFERGLSTWTTVGTVTTVSDPVHSGLAAAQVGIASVPRSTPATTSTLRKTFTVRTGHTRLTLWYEVICEDMVSLDWFTITLRDNTAGKTKTLLGHTCRVDSAFQSLTASVIAGHSYSLVMTARDDGNAGDPTWAYVDDVATS
jgi:hypothetical protein